MASSTDPDFQESHPNGQPTNISPSHWTGPGIFVRVEFGVSLSLTRTRRLSFGYASNMDHTFLQRQHPDRLAPGNDNAGDYSSEAQEREEEEERPWRPRRRQIRSRSALQLRTSPISPVSGTLSPEAYNQRDYHPFHPEPVLHPSPISARDQRPSQPSQSTYRPSPVSLNSYPSPHSSSYPPPQTPQARSSRMSPFAAVRQSTIDRRPLPPLPTRFRLGSDDLPWSSPTWVDPEEATYFEPSILTLAPSEARRDEDPQRMRELEQLNQAMMTIDSIEIGNQWWEPGGSYDRLGELGGLPGGPRGVGWAIAEPTREERRVAIEQGEGRDGAEEPDEELLSPPPPYTQGQWGWDWEWEETDGYWVRRGVRRRSSVR